MNDGYNVKTYHAMTAGKKPVAFWFEQRESASGYSLDVGCDGRRYMNLLVSKESMFAFWKAQGMDVWKDKYGECHVQWLDHDNIRPTEEVLSMVRCVFGYVIETFSNVDTFTFTDRSAVPCETFDMPYPCLHLALSGKTWYAEHFGAVLKDPEKQAIFANNVGVLTSAEFKRETSHKTFVSMNGFAGTPLMKYFPKDEYDESATFVDYFRSLDAKHGRGSQTPFRKLFFTRNFYNLRWGPKFIGYLVGLDEMDLHMDYVMSVDKLGLERSSDFTIREVRGESIEDYVKI